MSDELFYWNVMHLLGFGTWISTENKALCEEAYERWAKASGKTAADVAFGRYKPPEK